MSKTKWVAVYNGDGEHIAKVNERGEMKSLGPSNDKSARVRDEIRAATLAMSWCQQAPSDARGWMAHFMDHPPMPDCWAGWLEREISTHDEQREAERRSAAEIDCRRGEVGQVQLDALSKMVGASRSAEQAAATAHFDALCDAKTPVRPPPVKIDRMLMGRATRPDWQAGVLAECDKIDEQTRHDVAASVVRHDAIVYRHLPDGTPVRLDNAVLTAAEGSTDVFDAPATDPHASFTARFQADHTDDEPTQVGAVVDDRFDGSEP